MLVASVGKGKIEQSFKTRSKGREEKDNYLK